MLNPLPSCQGGRHSKMDEAGGGGGGGWGGGGGGGGTGRGAPRAPLGRANGRPAFGKIAIYGHVLGPRAPPVRARAPLRLNIGGGGRGRSHSPQPARVPCPPALLCSLFRTPRPVSSIGKRPGLGGLSGYPGPRTPSQFLFLLPALEAWPPRPREQRVVVWGGVG